MGADTQTLIAYSIALLTMISLLMIVFWVRGSRAPVYLWLAAALMLGGISGVLIIAESFVSSPWNLRLGASLVLLAYGCVWQAIRSLYDRRPLFWAILAPPMLWALLSDAILTPSELYAVGAGLRSAIIAAFLGAAAWELWRARVEDLPSRRVLFWLLSLTAGLAILRLLTTSVLEVPTPDAHLTWWLVAAFNLLVVGQALLVCLFSITLLHERTASSNYRMALVDPLTELANRRAFEQFVAEWNAGSSRIDCRVAVIFVDVDCFKQINDTYGHDIGDRILKAAARNLEQGMGPAHSAFRIGGDEFLCLLPGADATDAMAIAERLKTAFQFSVKGIEGFNGNATLSIGVAASAVVGPPARLTDLMLEADGALRLSKNTGRNLIQLAAN